MTAREMFKALGYKYYKGSDGYYNGEIIEYYQSETPKFIFCIKSREFCAEYCEEPKYITVDEFKAIQQQMKELGWIEEKPETNFEHYKDEIIEGWMLDLALVDGKLKRCSLVDCNECEFNPGANKGCKQRLIEWIKQPYKKLPYKLSQFEFDIIQTYRDCHESCKISEFKQLIELKDKGYFKCIDHDTKIQDVLKNCEVIQ